MGRGGIQYEYRPQPRQDMHMVAREAPELVLGLMMLGDAFRSPTITLAGVALFLGAIVMFMERGERQREPEDVGPFIDWEDDNVFWSNNLDVNPLAGPRFREMTRLTRVEFERLRKTLGVGTKRHDGTVDPNIYIPVGTSVHTYSARCALIVYLIKASSMMKNVEVRQILNIRRRRIGEIYNFVLFWMLSEHGHLLQRIEMWDELWFLKFKEVSELEGFQRFRKVYSTHSPLMSAVCCRLIWRKGAPRKVASVAASTALAAK
jgi:hypothetical protein